MHSKGDKSKPLHKDQGSAAAAKLDHKGMSHKSKQGQDCCKPGEFAGMSRNPAKGDFVWKKGVPSDGPFSAPHSGKPMQMKEGHKKSSEMPMKSRPARNSK
jgi:hypothetical protein